LIELRKDLLGELLDERQDRRLDLLDRGENRRARFDNAGDLRREMQKRQQRENELHECGHVDPPWL
jgi:hypothetical protein